MYNVEKLNAHVRPFVMLLFAIGFIAGFFMGLLGAEAFIGAFGVVQAWYFKSRDEAAARG